MRKLQTSDVFELGRVVKKVGLKKELKEIAIKTNKSNEEADEYSLGFDFVFGIIEKFIEKESENAIYDFLSGPFECSPEDVKRMDPIDLVEGIFEIASIDKWKSFLKLAVR